MSPTLLTTKLPIPVLAMLDFLPAGSYLILLLSSSIEPVLPNRRLNEESTSAHCSVSPSRLTLSDCPSSKLVGLYTPKFAGA
jgi:hypothetical protein